MDGGLFPQCIARCIVGHIAGRIVESSSSEAGFACRGKRAKRIAGPIPRPVRAFIALMTHWPAQERNRPSNRSPREILAANADLRFKPLKRSALEDGYVTAARSIIRYKMTDHEYPDPFLNAKLTYPETAAPKQSTALSYSSTP